MAYTNSSLVNYTKISPMKNYGRVHPTYNPSGVIDKITIHHMAGNLSVETCGSVFQTREASANYGIGSDGRIALYVDEKDRSWASSSPANDYRAVTIEVANNTGSPNWTVSDAAYASLIKLVVDICKRNNIKQLNYTGDASGNLTMHRFFAATACPGPYLKSKFPDIANRVNAQLSASTTSIGSFEKGSIVQFKGGAHYISASATTPSSTNLKAGPAKITAISAGAKHPYHIVHTDNQTTVYGWVDAASIGAPVASSGSTTSSKSSTTAKKVIAEDGSWGVNTTKYTQKLLGTIVDGIVSSQRTSCKKYLPSAHTGSWEFKMFGVGSIMIEALQKYVGLSGSNVDGLAGYNTVVALQKFLKNKGLYTGAIDGIMGTGTVKAWQKYINSKF